MSQFDTLLRELREAETGATATRAQKSPPPRYVPAITGQMLKSMGRQLDVMKKSAASTTAKRRQVDEKTAFFKRLEVLESSVLAKIAAGGVPVMNGARLLAKVRDIDKRARDLVAGGK